MSLVGYNPWGCKESDMTEQLNTAHEYFRVQNIGSKLSLAGQCMCTQSCLILCDPMDCSPPGSSVHGIFQAGILEWIAFSFSKGSSPPRINPCPLCFLHCQVRCFFLSLHLLGSPTESEVAQSCPTLCDSMACSLSGSVHGIFQATILEWVTISLSRRSFRPRSEPQSPVL